MLIHLRPRAYTRYQKADPVLVEFEIPQLKLSLRAGRDLTTGRPYANKGYRVGARKKSSRKAIDGLAIITDGKVRDFTAISRWSVMGTFVAEHRVDYRIGDEDFDAATDAMVCWSLTHDGERVFEARPCDSVADAAPVYVEPRMDFFLADEARRIGDIRDTVDDRGRITHRHERFTIPTVEPERLEMWDRRGRRVPNPADAFRV